MYLQEDIEDESTKNLPPWKLELMKKKQQPKLAPKPKPSKPPPATSKAENIRVGRGFGGCGLRYDKWFLVFWCVCVCVIDLCIAYVFWDQVKVVYASNDF